VDNLAATVQQLIEQAKQGGGPDNVTVILVKAIAEPGNGF
jgi:serine/threonine protein phosphatase PrpC